MPASLRHVPLITIKRKHIDLTREDRYGYWWFEIGDAADPASESYGWWPKYPVSLLSTLKGIEGELNGQTYFGGESNRDPHHGDEPDEQFWPCVSKTDPRTDGQIADCLRSFALSYRGQWRWGLGMGPNCHTFQEEAMRHRTVVKPPIGLRPWKGGS